MNKTTSIVILLLCLLSACSEKMICPAYQSVFILDDGYRNRYFSPFEVIAGDTVPRDHFDVQNHRSNFFITKIWTRPERPVLENPYLMARIFNKRPYWKLDVIKPELIHYVSTDTLRFGQSQVGLDSLEAPGEIESIIRYPLRIPPHNQEQVEYNKKFGHLFPRPPKPQEEIPVDTTTIQEFMADTLANETKKKRGVFGVFQKKNKTSKSKENKKDKEKGSTENNNNSDKD